MYVSMHLEYAAHMRTTISLEDRLAEEVKRRAAESGESVSAFIARVLDDSLKQTKPAVTPRPFKLITVSGEVVPGVNLDKPRLLEAIEDEETWESIPH